MTLNDFIHRMATQGIEQVLQDLLTQNVLAELQIERIRNLKRNFALGLISIPTATMEYKRIAIGILSLLEEEPGMENDQMDELDSMNKVSASLRALLGISAEEEAAAIASERESAEKIARARALYQHNRQSDPEEDYSPTPKDAIPDHKQLRNLIAQGEMLQVIRHLRGMAAGTHMESAVKGLVQKHMEFEHGQKYGLQSFESGQMMNAQIAAAMLDMLNEFPSRTTDTGQVEAAKKNWWQQFWKK